MTYKLLIAAAAIGLLVGSLLAYTRGRDKDDKALLFILGVLLGGSASPFLNVEDTADFRFHIYMLAGVAFGTVIGMFSTTEYMERFIYSREGERKLAQEARDQAKQSDS